jgi:hypothetical protein
MRPPHTRRIPAHPPESARLISPRLVALCVAVLLASPATAQDFACPPAGQMVALSDGRTLLQQGADRFEPLLCLRQTTRRGDAPVQERFWLNAIQEGEPEQRDARRAAMAGLLPFRAGATTQFTETRPTGEARTTTFTVREIGPKTLPAGSFTVVTLLEETSFPAGKIVGLHGLDAATGTYLSFWGEFQMGGMHTRAIESQATAITPAAGR